MKLVVCPLRIERELLLKFLQEEGYVAEKKRLDFFEAFYFPRLDLWVAQGGHGKVQFGIQTQFLIQTLRDLKVVFCLGCAGALNPKLKLGDVVLGRETVEYDYILKLINKPQPRFRGDDKWLEAFQATAPKGFNIQLGAIASGDEDVVDSERALEISRSTGALAVAWEGAGGARACQFNRVPFLEIRGITDMADSSSLPDFDKSLTKAMGNLSQCLIAGLLRS